MARLYSNNFSTTLNGAITDVATSMTLTSVTGFPAVGAGDTAQITITDGTNTEVVTATAIAGSVITITRGQEGTSGTAFADNKTVELRITALSHTDVLSGDESPTLAGDLDVGAFAITSPDGTDKLDIDNGSVILRTNNISRISATDLGMRIGTGKTVSTILDEDNMISNSVTALATQQSIKAYVDSEKAINATSISFDSGTNTLDQYEEGTFTPVYAPTTNSFTSSTQTATGTYTRIGDTVICNLVIHTSAITLGTGSGQVKITGFPFTASATQDGYGTPGIFQSFNLVTATEGLGVIVASSSTYARITVGNSNGSITYADVTELTTGASFKNFLGVTVTYKI